MKKNLLLMMLCCPAMLAAQNGVTVSGLAVDAGTVTFNVSWQTPMPVALWSDTVWVFVDYNNAGKMERLPVTGATASAGTVTKISNNDKGVWVAGNARTQGSFSATVKLFTVTTDLAGVCAYASNYPPVGEYSNSDAAEITFTGTPKYDLVLEKIADGSTYTISTTGLYSIHAGEVIQSFTDATGAPGIMKCVLITGDIDFTVPALVSKNMQASFVVSSEPNTPNPALITYSWSAPDFSPVTQDGKTFTATAPEIAGTYPVTLTAQSERYCDLAITKDVEVADCTAPGSTVTFTAFNPCNNAITGDYWFLIDERESDNVQTYKVKKMADGRIWMAQDLKFGDKCDKTNFTGSGKDQTGNVTSLKDKTYYGYCTNMRNASTPSNRGYLYDWAAAINKAGAYSGSSAAVGCSGTSSGTVSPNPSSCQGICPDGWHVPTGYTAGEQIRLLTASGYTSNYSSTFWLSNTIFEGTSYHWVASSTVYSTTIYHSSSSYNNSEEYTVCNGLDTGGSCNNWTIYKSNSAALRCLMNY